MDGEKMRADQDDAITVINARHELPAVIRDLTADRMMAIIDMAQNGDTRELFALYRDMVASDNHVAGEFTKRKGAILGDVANLFPYDSKDAESVRAKNLCMAIIDGEAFFGLQQWLLNATLYPVAVCEAVYAPTPTGYTLAKVVPVPYVLLDYRDGNLRIFDVDGTGRPLDTSHAVDPNRYIVHRGHSLPYPDQWGGPMRAVLFWWLLRTMSRQWWADFLERFGIPFMKGKFNDEAGKAVLARAFQMAVKLGAIVISKNTEAEIVQTATGDSSGSHEKFIELCNREMSKLIVGQVLSSSTKPTGELGSGTASLQGEVRDDLRKMDARMLSMTIRNSLFLTLCRINLIRAQPPIIVFGSDSGSELASLMGLIKALSDAGFEPDDDGMDTLRERLGFGIRRKQGPHGMAPFHAVPLSADGAEPYAKSLADAFQGRLAKIADIIRSAQTPEDCISAVREFCKANKIDHIAGVIENALTAYAYQGTASSAKGTGTV